MLFFTILSTVY